MSTMSTNMPLSNDSTPTAADAAGGAEAPLAPTASGAAPDVYAAIALAQASGIALNTFGIRDNQGVMLLSLSPEGTFES